ncbi:MAG: thiamine diphosphokinase [Eubacteriales bacterium]|nr:thiamine diphosphokinase [Eubacteriales bacterium]
MKRCVIIGGSEILNYQKAKNFISSQDYIICCDCGLRHLSPLGITPDLIIGDFDSHENPKLSTETIVLPREKDDTDTFYAAKEALKRGFEDFLLIGVTGKRLDHTLGNISILFYLFNRGKNAVIIDDYSQMEIVGTKEKTVTDNFPYFSLLAIDGDAEGVNIQNAKFPLTDGKISARYQYGISNEVIKGRTAQITVKHGKLLLVKVEND